MSFFFLSALVSFLIVTFLVSLSLGSFSGISLITGLLVSSCFTFGISIAVITILLAGYGIYKGFFANKGLTDPWDDHDD